MQIEYIEVGSSAWPLEVERIMAGSIHFPRKRIDVGKKGDCVLPPHNEYWDNSAYGMHMQHVGSLPGTLATKALNATLMHTCLFESPPASFTSHLQR